MVTIKFGINEEKIAKAGYTLYDMNAFLDNYFVVERHAPKTGIMTYKREDENAMADFGMILIQMREEPDFMGYFSYCHWSVDGEEEDCLANIQRYIARWGR